MGDYALKDNTILLSCVPIACFMDTGSIIFNTAFKYMGGPKNGTGPDRGEEWSTCPIAMRCCPVCGVNLPAGLHVCRSCSKPIHYPDGIFYADLKDMFSVEYYGIQAKWFYDLIRSDDLGRVLSAQICCDQAVAEFPGITIARRRSQKTAFFGVSAIQCASVAITLAEVELFKKNVRGTLQGAIRLDMSVERLVAGMTGKESKMSVEEFFATATAIPVVKHFGSLYLNCREKPVCFLPDGRAIAEGLTSFVLRRHIIPPTSPVETLMAQPMRRRLMPSRPHSRAWITQSSICE